MSHDIKFEEVKCWVDIEFLNCGGRAIKISATWGVLAGCADDTIPPGVDDGEIAKIIEALKVDAVDMLREVYDDISSRIGGE